MIYELLGYSTEERGEAAVRHREYTKSKTKADLFASLKRIQFSDSGHGIVFTAGPLSGSRKAVRRMESVDRRLAELRAQAKQEHDGKARNGRVEAAARRLVDVEPDLCLDVAIQRSAAMRLDGIEALQPIDGARYLARVALGLSQ